MSLPRVKRVEQISSDDLLEDHLCLVVFGPGEGEAMVVRLPDGRIGVVDGCREPTRGRRDGEGDPVREFLNGIEGLARNQEGRLAFVCLTHPHQDHYRGLARLLKAYRGRIDRVVTFAQHGGRIAKAVAKLASAGSEEERRALSGFPPVVREVDWFSDHHDHSLRCFGPETRISHGEEGGHRFEVFTCGPMAGDLRRFEHRWAETRDEHDRIAFDYEQDPNRLSGALHVSWGDAHVMLGGDLLAQKGSEYKGWGSLREDSCCSMSVVKSAHHGSEEAHDDERWSEWSPVLSIITPFRRARVNDKTDPPEPRMPPKPNDVERLIKDSTCVVTSPPQWHEARYRRAGWPVAQKADGDYHSTNPIHNAVAVSIKSDGTIACLVLGGQADVYGMP